MGRGRPPKQPRPKNEHIRIGFDTDTVTLTLDQIIPLKIITPHLRQSRRYKQIMVSIREVGIIEPPVVSQGDKGRYMLLDGHLRFEALKELGETEVTCLVSTDDESFTYNKHINHLSPVQEHRMILKAIERGVTEEKIAQALDMDVQGIVRRKNMLNGICPEAVDLLKDKMMASDVFFILKQMVAVRQVEAATLMNDAAIYTVTYAKALLATTPKELLMDPQKPKKIKGLSDEQMVRMENETSTLHREYQLIEENYGIDFLNLTVAKGYLSSLLSNAKIVRYLAQNHPEFLSQFQKITEMTSLNGKDAAA
jgi:hypothetical protein